MASHEAVVKVAKILARATSSFPAEAELALQSAYKRMKRDGVELKEILNLPIHYLYKDPLIKFAKLVVDRDETISSADKTGIYQGLILIIEDIFPKQKTQQNTGETEREKEAQEYQQRHGYQNKQTNTQDTQNTESQHHGQYSQQSTSYETEPQTEERKYRFGFGKREFDFSVDGFLQSIRPLLRVGDFLLFVLRYPSFSFRMMGAGLLWGMGFAMVLLTLLALVHVITGTSPLFDFPFKYGFWSLTGIGAVWKCRELLKSG